MMKKIINFKKDWNGKLSGQSIFTTIRRVVKLGPIEAGDRVGISLNDKELFRADVLDIIPYNPSKVPDTHEIRCLLMMDTGISNPYDAYDLIKSMTKGDSDCAIVVLRRTENQLFD